MITIAADSQIPNLKKYLLEYFFVDEFSLFKFQSENLNAKLLEGVDVLLVRSTVKVNKQLCKLSELKFVGSATSGINHLDIKFLEANNIAWSYAPGCNASSVTHYVMAVIGELIQQGLFNVRQKVGIVGYGNVGRQIFELLSSLNIQTYVNDPFLSDPHLVELDEILQCDLISIHTPYTDSGKHPTKELINLSHSNFINNKILINTSRGGVVDEELVLKLDNLIYIADVWMNEPAPDPKLIKKAFIATPHIAGYSLEGKIKGSSVITEECAKFFNKVNSKNQIKGKLRLWPHNLNQIIMDLDGYGFPINLFNRELNIRLISDQLKGVNSSDLPSGFKSLRIHHPDRHDFNIYSYRDLLELDKEFGVSFFQSIQEIN